MANNRQPDTDSGDTTEPESDSETEQAQRTQTTPYSQFPSQPEPFSSSDEEDEDSDSDSDPTRITSNGARRPRSMLTSAVYPGKSINDATKLRSKPSSAGIRDEPGKSSNSARKPRPKLVSAGQPPEEENGTDGKKLKGREMILPNLHEQTAYELSKCIWGKKDNENEGGNVTVNAKANESVVRRSQSKRKGDDGAFSVAKRAKTVEEMVMSMGDKLFKTGEEGEEWNELKLEDMKTYLRHLEVKTKQTKLVIDSLKSGVFRV